MPQSPSRLIDARGDVRCGIFPAPIDEVNYRDFDLRDPFDRRRRRLRRYFDFKQFQFLGGLSETLVFGCAIADLRYVGTAFAYVYDPQARRFSEFSVRAPLNLGVTCDQLPETGTAAFRRGGNRIVMRAYERPRARHLEVQLGNELSIDATFDEEAPPLQPMYICTPAGPTGWVYARKTAGHAVSGTVRWGERVVDLAAIGTRGHHDWSAGYMRRETFWNWGCLAGVTDGRIVGLNVSCGVNETGVTESCFWLDGQLHKLDSVSFACDRRDVMQPWQIRSYDGRLDLFFVPEGRHRERLNAGFMASNFNQLCGRYSGHLDTAAGERIRITDMLGYLERHYAKW